MRVDTGVREGDLITPHYDPMIAKLIVWGEDRAAAVRRLAAALAEYEVVGVQTNLGLLRAIAEHPAFAEAALDTGFIARHAADLLPGSGGARVADTDDCRRVGRRGADRAARPARGHRGAGARHRRSLVALDRGGCVADERRRLPGPALPPGRRRAAAPITLRSHPLPDGSFRLDLPTGAVRAALTGGRGEGRCSCSTAFRGGFAWCGAGRS